MKKLCSVKVELLKLCHISTQIYTVLCSFEQLISQGNMTPPLSASLYLNKYLPLPNPETHVWTYIYLLLHYQGCENGHFMTKLRNHRQAICALHPSQFVVTKIQNILKVTERLFVATGHNSLLCLKSTISKNQCQEDCNSPLTPAITAVNPCGRC